MNKLGLQIGPLCLGLQRGGGPRGRAGGDGRVREWRRNRAERQRRRRAWSLSPHTSFCAGDSARATATPAPQVRPFLGPVCFSDCFLAPQGLAGVPPRPCGQGRGAGERSSLRGRRRPHSPLGLFHRAAAPPLPRNYPPDTRVGLRDRLYSAAEGIVAGNGARPGSGRAEPPPRGTRALGRCPLNRGRPPLSATPMRARGPHGVTSAPAMDCPPERATSRGRRRAGEAPGAQGVEGGPAPRAFGGLKQNWRGPNAAPAVTLTHAPPTHISSPTAHAQSFGTSLALSARSPAPFCPPNCARKTTRAFLASVALRSPRPPLLFRESDRRPAPDSPSTSLSPE